MGNPFKKNRVGAPGAVLGGLALLALVGIFPGTAAAVEVVISRNAFTGQADRPTQPLPPGQPTELRSEIRRVTGVTHLRVVPAEPSLPVVFRFRNGAPGALILTVIVVTRPGYDSYYYRERSEELRNGVFVRRQDYWQGEFAETELEGKPGRVAEIHVQDDLAAEIRLTVEGENLVLRAVPPEQGGNLTGGRLPPFLGKPLRFLDYNLLAAGYTDNVHAEVVFLRDFALAVNYVTDGTTTATVVRGVARQQAARWERISIWLEGGAGYYTLDPVDESDTTADALTWQFGVSTDYRFGDWGAAGAVSTTNGANLILLMGGWQFSKSYAALLEWQSFQGLSAFGLGMTMGF